MQIHSRLTVCKNFLHIEQHDEFTILFVNATYILDRNRTSKLWRSFYVLFIKLKHFMNIIGRNAKYRNMIRVFCRRAALFQDNYSALLCHRSRRHIKSFAKIDHGYSFIPRTDKSFYIVLRTRHLNRRSIFKYFLHLADIESVQGAVQRKAQKLPNHCFTPPPLYLKEKGWWKARPARIIALYQG